MFLVIQPEVPPKIDKPNELDMARIYDYQKTDESDESPHKIINIYSPNNVLEFYLNWKQKSGLLE